MYRELREAHQPVSPDDPNTAPLRRGKTAGRALFQIIVADLSMSLDNVIAIAGVARAQSEPWVLIVGLLLSVALMGVASGYVARLLERVFWLSWVGLGIVTLVALRLIWDGSAQIVS
jgi:predicted tellurium resistance membrane protein TerC